jgi:hypothetical protein
MSLLFLFNAIAPLPQHCYFYVHSSSMRLGQILFYYIHDVVVPCSTLLLLLLLFQIGIPPLQFLQVWEKLSKFLKLDLEGEFFLSIFVC